MQQQRLDGNAGTVLGLETGEVTEELEFSRTVLEVEMEVRYPSAQDWLWFWFCFRASGSVDRSVGGCWREVSRKSLSNIYEPRTELGRVSRTLNLDLNGTDG